MKTKKFVILKKLKIIIHVWVTKTLFGNKKISSTIIKLTDFIQLEYLLTLRDRKD